MKSSTFRNITEFNKPCSADARKIRDEILYFAIKNRCAKHGQSTRTEFKKWIIDHYDPVDWEKPVFCSYPDLIIKSIYKTTSAKFSEVKDHDGILKPPWDRGSETGRRDKNVDWYSVAKCDPKWWYFDDFQFPRKHKIKPSIFNGIIGINFCKVYNLFTSWLISDFSYVDLYSIYCISRDNTYENIELCINDVSDFSKRTVPYIRKLIDNRRIIKKKKIEEDTEEEHRSMLVVKKMFDSIKDCENVDWDRIKSELENKIQISKDFNDIKLS